AHRPNVSRLRASSQSSRPSRCAALKCTLRVTLTVGIHNSIGDWTVARRRIVARHTARGKRNGVENRAPGRMIEPHEPPYDHRAWRAPHLWNDARPEEKGPARVQRRPAQPMHRR